jgi:hypothetical protein
MGAIGGEKLLRIDVVPDARPDELERNPSVSPQHGEATIVAEAWTGLSPA